MAPDHIPVIDPQTRDRVNKLFHQGLDSKLLRHHSAQAMKMLREAYELTHHHERTPRFADIWPALTAYRLAHLTLRRPDLTYDELMEVDEWLIEACRQRVLGPWPCLYRLAVMHRLKANDLIDGAFAHARERVLQHLDEESAQLQSHIFNALELSAYFLGQPYHSLEGIGEIENRNNPYAEFGPPGQKWMLVGPDPLISKVKYPREFALQELGEQGGNKENDKKVVLFKLPESLRHEWKLTSQAGYEPVPNSHTAKLLAAILLVKSRAEAQDLMGLDNPNTFRSAISRGKKDFERLTGYPLEDTPNGLPKVPSQVVVYGAVDCNALATPR
ncbi:MAG: hypothetical protein KF868_10450 [Acidobacteria bacterium]|nr:hypothetical protein [Acidobacteriota bacterium]MCW5969895.1 hypothetical protein [Blastocatellales bacterium]